MWGCTISKGALRIFTNRSGYTSINAEKIASSLQKLSQGEIFQHVNDPMHTAKIMQEFSKKKKKCFQTEIQPNTWGIWKRKVEQ